MSSKRPQNGMDTAEVRRRWLAFFADKGHTIVPSAPLIHEDPNLLFVNAGMVPFKPYFLGQENPPFPRATSVQKCVRTGDIDEVGKTSRHGTFFQMNGNFSFGDYFKEGAITLAWELLTTSIADGGYGLDPERLWPTVYTDDDEAWDIWANTIGIPTERITRRGAEDNFWSMGVPGPGGPCSEIFYDRGPEYGQDGGPAIDEDRFMEVWNLVFMQYELSEVRSKADFDISGNLPAQNIDTGMGLERMACIQQGVDNLYEIDEVFPVLAKAAQLARVSYGATSGKVAAESDPTDVHLRVVADHVRTSLMLIGDGVTPGNEGRGYVLRRMLRRAVRAMRLLGYEKPALPELLPISMEYMSRSYPELRNDFPRISQIAYEEEKAFRRTLDKGTQLLDKAVAAAQSTKQDGPAILPGLAAFTLHDTYGFPIDLTLEMAAEQGVQVDSTGFAELMAEQKLRAKTDAAAKKTGHADTSVWAEIRAQGATDFLAYTGLETEAQVRGLLVDGKPAAALEEGQIGQIVLDRTTFYAESGGQVADAGTIETPTGVLKVLDVQRPVKGLIAHTVKALEGSITTGENVHAQVDPEWRLSACQAHSGTHVVHAALREVLGPQALQSGSYNKPGYLRLDFAWNYALSPTTRSEIEEVANKAVRADLPVSAEYMTLPEARKKGALALFGETYDEQVRVIEIGGRWSRELCGGTHVAHSSQIGALSLTGESSVGSGVRRVEAFVGIEALQYLARERAIVSEIATLTHTPAAELVPRITELLARVKRLERQITELKQAETLAAAGSLLDKAQKAGPFTLITDYSAERDGDSSRSLALDLRDKLGASPGVVAIAGRANDRPILVIATTAAARDLGAHAGNLVRNGAKILGGGGGGKPDIAQGGGKNLAAVPDALAVIARDLSA